MFMLLVGVAGTEARGTETGKHVALGLWGGWVGGVVTLQGRDKNFSTQTRGTERDHGENVKASSFPPVFADEMTYRPV